MSELTEPCWNFHRHGPTAMTEAEMAERGFPLVCPECDGTGMMPTRESKVLFDEIERLQAKVATALDLLSDPATRFNADVIRVLESAAPTEEPQPFDPRHSAEG